eukprot:14766227-Alexandrium_andersonii.AAC.1
MSASLVGSEMCIRDRPLVGSTRAPPSHTGAPREFRVSSSRGPRELHASSCLLYTSDAADDM